MWQVSLLCRRVRLALAAEAVVVAVDPCEKCRDGGIWAASGDIFRVMTMRRKEAAAILGRVVDPLALPPSVAGYLRGCAVEVP